MGFADLLTVVDRTVRTQLGEPGILYTSGGGAAVSVTGIFEANHVSIDTTENRQSSQGPAVFLTISDLTSDPSVDVNFRVTRGGTVYKRGGSIQPDGTGAVLILLHEVA